MCGPCIIGQCLGVVSLSTTWVLGTEPMPSCLVIGIFTYEPSHQASLFFSFSFPFFIAFFL